MLGVCLLQMSDVVSEEEVDLINTLLLKELLLRYDFS